jgi:short-subunit dehydrogenase
MRRELKQFNVKVLLVAAGFVQTEIIRKSVDSMKLADGK